MKLNSKNSSVFIQILLISTIIGTLSWALLEIILKNFGFEYNLSLGTIGFDLVVLSVHLLLNPGSIIGAAGGIILFIRL